MRFNSKTFLALEPLPQAGFLISRGSARTRWFLHRIGTVIYQVEPGGLNRVTGMGKYIENGSNTIQNFLILYAGYSDNPGAAIYVMQCDPLIKNNIVAESAVDGIYAERDERWRNRQQYYLWLRQQWDRVKRIITFDRRECDNEFWWQLQRQSLGNSILGFTPTTKAILLSSTIQF